MNKNLLTSMDAKARKVHVTIIAGQPVDVLWVLCEQRLFLS